VAQIPTNPGGTGGITTIEPSRELANYCEPNRHTVFIFTADWCPGCRSLEAYLPGFLELRKDVAIRQIRVDDARVSETVTRVSGVKLRSIPHVVIYDAQGNIAAADDGNDKSGLEMLMKWIQDESNKARGGGQ